MKRWMVALAGALLMGAAPAFAQAPERVVAPVGGISIEKPGGWIATPPSEAMTNLGKIDYDSPEFQRVVTRDGAVPLIVFSKYPDSHGGIVPTIKVNFRRTPWVRQVGAIGAVEGVIGAMRRGFGAVEILEAPADTAVGGQPAAHARIRYTIKGEGDSHDTNSEMWIVPRGDYILIVGTGYASDEPEATRAEILAAVASVRIEP